MRRILSQRHGWGRERGVAGLMAMIFLLVVVAFSAVTLLSMSSSDLHDTTAQNDGVAALFLAESGIERASQLYSAGTACGAGLLPPSAINFGRGSFQSSGAVGYPKPLTLPTRCTLQVQGLVGATTRTIEADLGRSNIALLSTSSRAANGSFAWNHTIPPTIGGIPVGPNRIVVVGVSIRGAATILSGTYNGVAMTRAGFGGLPAAVVNGNVRVEWLYKLNPPTGTSQIRIILSGNARVVGGAFAFSGVDPVTPIDASAPGTGNSTNAGVSVTPVTDKSWVVDVLAAQLNTTATAGASQLPAAWVKTTPGGATTGVLGAGSYRGPISPPAPVSMSWTLAPANVWAHSVLALRPIVQVVRWTEL